MKRIFALAAAFALSGSMALAAITAEDVVKTYQDAGYVRIEVETGPTQIKLADAGVALADQRRVAVKISVIAQ